MPVDPLKIVPDYDKDGFPDAPPSVSNYREAEIQGVACWNCAHFTATDSAGDVPQGICNLWEAQADGAHVCDRFTAHADLNELAPHQSTREELMGNGPAPWEFADNDRAFAEIHLAGADTREEEGFVIKEILRTGEWPVIPTGAGQIKKPLRITRDGSSDREAGTISMAEVVENFKNGALDRVQIPLTDEEKKDHKNLTRLNTGFVRDIWIVDEGDVSKLVAKMEFTEPEVRDKVLRGTFADVSCGIPWNLVSRGKKYGTTLEHVALTNKPFIDGLGPFLAASNVDEGAEVAHFGTTEVIEEVEQEQETPPEAEVEESPKEEEEKADTPLSFREILAKAQDKITSSTGYGTYRVVDIMGENLLVENTDAETTWTVPFKVEAGSVEPAAITDWVVKEEGNSDAPAEQTPAAPRQSSDDELEAAYREREIRMSDSPRPTPTERSGHMPLTQAELDRLELSDDQRAVFQRVLDENAQLSRTQRESEADSRIAALEELGLKERPGALKLYRQVMLSDDGGPAVVLLSDDGKEKERLTALEILDQFIEATKGSDGKVTLSDQALVSGSDIKPPADASEEKPLAERLDAAKESLYGDRK